MQKILVLTPPLGGVCRGLLHGCENFADLRFQMYCEIGGVSGEDIIWCWCEGGGLMYEDDKCVPRPRPPLLGRGDPSALAAA